MAEDPEKLFVADMGGIFAQHAGMWPVYIESVKILVSVTSLPILAAALLISVSKGDLNPLDFTNLNPVIVWTLAILPVLDLLLLGVVIQHRLVILFYARALNGYRKLYLDTWNKVRKDEHPITLAMPTDEKYPPNAEWFGPMGLIVHCTALVNSAYAFGAFYGGFGWVWRSLAAAGAVVALYEAWYAWNCRPLRGPHVPVKP